MAKICPLIILFLIELAIATADQNTKDCSGVPGIPGLHGAPGRDGRDGAKGEKGDAGRMGEKGELGPRGIVGIKGNSGKVGARGAMGPRGMKGESGSKGSKGEQGDAVRVNWKQCVWDRNDVKDTGVIQECRFTKTSQQSALRVAYAGNLRVYCRDNAGCCSRWYFTFNGNECSGPMTIEGLVYSNQAKDNVHRHRQIEGYCENIPAGQIKVAFHVGKCSRYNSGTTYDAYT